MCICASTNVHPLRDCKSHWRRFYVCARNQEESFCSPTLINLWQLFIHRKIPRSKAFDVINGKDCWPGCNLRSAWTAITTLCWDAILEVEMDIWTRGKTRRWTWRRTRKGTSWTRKGTRWLDKRFWHLVQMQSTRTCCTIITRVPCLGACTRNGF